ncbi:hypothetical protein D3C77_538030 [compost metagenome]
MTGDGRIQIGAVAVLEVDVQTHVDTTEADTARLIRIEGASARGLQRDIVVTGIGDLELGAAGEGDGIGFTTTKTIVVHRTARDLTIGQPHTTIVRRWRG